MNPLCCIAPVSIDDRTNPVIAKPASNHQLGLPPSNHASKPSFSTQASWISQDQLERLSSEDVNLEGKDSTSNGGFFFGNGSVGAGGGVAGIMYKWTHYGKGWRARWFELEDGVLSYYKIHGPDKIVMNPAREKGVRVIGEESVRYIRKASFGGSSNKLGAGAGAASRPCKPFGEVHLKVQS